MPMLLQIRGHHLPGRTWRAHDEQYDNVHAGARNRATGVAAP
jgi:hypothetical protein